MAKIKYMIPNFMSFGRNEILMKLYKKYPHVMRDDTEIYTFYGVFPGAIWNGGRLSVSEFETPKSFMKKVSNFYNKRGISLTYTFTNPLLKHEHLSNEYCNTMLSALDNGFNEINISSDILEDYIRQNFPGYKINKSITATAGKSFEPDEKYHIVVIAKRENKNWELLKSIKNKKQVEILCDELCKNGCPFIYKHYRDYSMFQLGQVSDDPYFMKCRHMGKGIDDGGFCARNRESWYYIPFEDIKKYTDLGYQYFKLSAPSRDSNDLTGLQNIMDYCVKPEYQMDVYTYVLERILLEFSYETMYKLENSVDYKILILNKFFGVSLAQQSAQQMPSSIEMEDMSKTLNKTMKEEKFL